MHKTIKALVVAQCAVAAFVVPASAQDKVTLKFADWMSLSHYTVDQAAVPFLSLIHI